MADTASSTEVVREILREKSRIIRRNKRDNLLDQRRGVEACNLDEEMSPEEIRELAHSLRKRGATDINVLTKLQRGLLQGPDRVSMFLSTDGALNGLIKALSGLDPALELKAAYCICNLALTEGRAAAKISKTAAPYLIVHIEGMNPLMQDACAWALGNLAAGGRHSWSLLHAQEVLPKLAHLLNSPHADVVSAAIYSLTHFIRAQPETTSIGVSELKDIATKVAPLMTQYHAACLLFLLSSTAECDEELCAASVPEKSVAKISNLLASSDLNVKTNLCELTFLIRTIANLSSESNVGALSTINAILISSSNLMLPSLLKSTTYPHVIKETQWLLANLFNHNNVDVGNLAKNLIPLTS